VEQQARTAWSNLETAQKRVESLSTQVDILFEFLEIARKERRLGKRSLLDVLSGEVDYIIAQSSLAAARAETVKAAFELLYAMGRLSPESLNLRAGG
jgi:outer membrane protein TolC